MLPAIETAIPTLALIAVAAYLLGSVPFGLVIARIMGLGNLREIGSGNIGATNVLRTGSKTAAFLTVLFDAGKGGVAVIIAGLWFGADAAQIAGLCAFLGHLFPIWLRFKGGKGVATFLGILIAISFWAGFATCMTWLAIAVIFRFSSLAALVSAAAAPLWLYVIGPANSAMFALVMALLIWVRHKDNITRLVAGNETRIGKK